MAPLSEMYEDFKIAKVTPISKVEEAIIRLIKEMEATVVNQNEGNLKKIMFLNAYLLKLLTEQNIQFFKTDGGENHHSFCNAMSQAEL